LNDVENMTQKADIVKNYSSYISKFQKECNSKDRFKKFVKELAEILRKEDINNRERVETLKKKLAKKYKLLSLPPNADIYNAFSEKEKEEFRQILLKKPSRTLSGVAPVAVMTSPAPCPHGKCLYCPGGVENNSPQSYTGKEPAALRASNFEYDPFLQVAARLSQYRATGHTTDKIELIVMGGTFPARDLAYQEWFVKRCFDAMNSFQRGKDWTATTLEMAQKRNEKAKARCIGLTIETRPDWCKEEHINQILKLGGTRVELGVQSLYNDILKKIERGHTVEDTVVATRLLKDSGLKVCYHLMPGLPGSDYSRSLNSLKKIFQEENFMPDMLKIYPTLVVKGTKLYELYKKGEYTPLSTEEAVELIAEAKASVPPWVRIQRIQRDIPSGLIKSGVKKSDLRMIVKRRMKERGLTCSCIRCREVGFSNLSLEEVEECAQLFIRSYKASAGVEYFLSYELSHLKSLVLIGYCRLRIPSEKAFRKEIKGKKAGLIRELKVFGEAEQIGKRSVRKWQHRGFGRRLLEEAERIAAENWDRRLMLVTSGVGVRDYYRKFGYRKRGPYMGKITQAREHEP